MTSSDFEQQREARAAAENAPDPTDSAASQTESGRMPTDDVGDALSHYDAMTDDEASGDGDGPNDINITESNGPFLEAGDDLDTGAGHRRHRD